MILHYMESESIKNVENYNILEDMYHSLCERIIEDKINLYSNDNYCYGNIWGLYHYDKEKVIEYTESMVNETNVFKFINDLVTHSIGTNGYGYHIKKHNVDTLGPNVDIRKLVDLYDRELTDDQEFLLNIYNLYANHSENNYRDDEIYEKDYRNISNV